MTATQQQQQQQQQPLTELEDDECSYSGAPYVFWEDDTASSLSSTITSTTASSSSFDSSSHSSSSDSDDETGDITIVAQHHYHSQPHHHNPHHHHVRKQQSERSKIDFEIKNAKNALEGSILAVLNFLKSSGVSEASIEQLDKNLKLGRYFAVLKRAQDYIVCIRNNAPSVDTFDDKNDTTLAKVYLAVYAWEALCRLKALEYKRAYRYCFRLRYELKNSSSYEIKKAISLQVKHAEQSTVCQKKLYLVKNWQRRIQKKYDVMSSKKRRQEKMNMTKEEIATSTVVTQQAQEEVRCC